MFTLQFAQTDKARNSTFVPPMSGATAQVLLREETSVVTPTFRMRLDYEGMATATELMQYNYAYCPEFKRYYFITNISSYTAVIFDIECICDVLATFREDILDTKVWVMYAQSQYNSMLADHRVPISDRSNMEVVTNAFDICDDTGCFILTLASDYSTGETGCAQSYALTGNAMKIVAEHLYSTDFLDQVVKYFTNPMDAVIACKWVPIKRTEAGTGNTHTINIGDFNLGAGMDAKKNVSGTIQITPYVHYKSQVWNPVTNSYEYSWADYRNVEPYSQYTMWLPGVGTVQIPMSNIIGNGQDEPKFDIEYVASPCTGDITYLINRINQVSPGSGLTKSTIMTVSGNFGVDIPVASAGKGYVPAIANVAEAVGAAVVSSVAPAGKIYDTLYGVRAVENVAEAIGKAAMTRTSVSGTLGGWAAKEDMYNQISVYTTFFATSDNPSNIGEAIGRPLFQAKKLSSMSGLVKCTGAYVKTWATEQEHQMIAQYVNSSTNFIFGGLIVE